MLKVPVISMESIFKERWEVVFGLKINTLFIKIFFLILEILQNRKKHLEMAGIIVLLP